MTPSRLDRRSVLLRRVAKAALSRAIEPLESRRLMCTLHGPELTDALDASRAHDSAPATNNHGASWYKPAATRTIGGRIENTLIGRAGGDDVPAGSATFNVNAAGLPLLTSRADNAGLKVFLDFDGYGTDTSFSTDDDGSIFIASEQNNIYSTWRDIVSYLSPFNVNVTTVQPPTGGSNPAFIWHRISNSIQGGAAYVGWFTNDRSNSWTGQDGGTNRHSGVAHEIGHQLGLSHQAEHDALGVETTDYSDGFGNRDRPIIGVDFAENVRTWFYGRNSDSVLNLQDDVAIMANTIAGRVGGDGFRPDDVGNTIASALSLPASGMFGGITERMNDSDVFRFTSAGGTYLIDATPTFESAASPKIELLDATGNVIAARDDADRRNFNNNDQEFSLNLAAGTYYVRVASSGDYGELGEYLVTAAPLPTGWTSQDIGANAIFRGGTAAMNPSTNTLTQLGGGNDIWSTNDQFRFTSTTLTGNGSITARIDSLDDVDIHSKAGVMIRAFTSVASAHVYVGIKPSGQLDPIVRASNGGASAAIGNPAGTTGPWVRLTRSGNLFTIERSADGIGWTNYGSTTITMGSTVQIGFATSSRSARQAAYASFSNISVTGTLGNAAPTFSNLPAPAGLTASPTAGANTSVDLAWSAVTDATGYALERSFDGATYQIIANLGAAVTSFTDANLFGSMRYFYRVSATLTGQPRSVPSPAVSVINKPGRPLNPNPDYALPIIRFEATRMLLNWTDVQGETGYRIERAGGNGAFATIATTAANRNAYNDANLAAGTLYTYRVTPLTTVGDDLTLAWTTSATTPLTAAAGFRVSARTPTSLTLAWTDLAGETAYRLERSSDAATWTTVADLGANATTYNDAVGLAPLTRYYYRLRALDAGGAYGNAAAAFAATPASTPLPTNWSSADVGDVPGAGAAGTSGNTWSVIGSGADIWGQSDAFHYLSRGITGNGSITARLTSLDNTDFFVKAGVMFRESAAANSPYVFMHYSSGPGLQLEYRDAAGASSGNAFQLQSDARWLRLTRSGNVFVAAYSADGISWQAAGSRTVAMSNVASAGLAATSHNLNRLTLATFDNVASVGAGINRAPTITVAAAANPSPVTGTTATLTVGATDDNGAANLSYLWSAISTPAGVAAPTYSINDVNGASTTVATFSAAGRYVLRVTVRDAQGLTASSDVTVNVALRSLSAAFQHNAARPKIVVQFNGDVTSTLSAADLVLTNVTTGEVIPSASIVGSFDAATNTAAFTFNTADGTLPDGNYTATLAAGSLAEPSGVVLASDVTMSFFVLAGDANRDRQVNFADLVRLAQSYGQGGKTFEDGDFNYDGTVNFADLVILAQRYNQVLEAPPSTPAPAALTSSAKRKPTARTSIAKEL